MRILYVDNHRELTSVVVAKFLGEHAVSVVPTIAAARAAMEASLFDVVLVDYDLDDGKGDELVRWLRARGSAVPVIAVSAHERGNAALVRAGADATCPKLELARIGAVISSVTLPP